MSNLITITTRFYDKSGSYFANLEVQSRYKGSSKVNMQKTNDQGVFVFQASPNRTIEILARPPKQKDFTVFKTINSSIFSSRTHPFKVQLPITIAEYNQVNQPKPAKGIVSTVFKITDSNGKVMKNFPVQSRPKGKGNSPDKYTNDDGIVEVLSSPHRDIEVLVLTSKDEFQLNFSGNSGNGAIQPIIIKLDEPYANFKSSTTIKILDRDGNDYIVEKTHLEMLILESGKKQLYSISNGRLPLQSMIGQKLEFVVYKPDGKPLKPISYFARRMKNKSLELHLDVDITKGNTKLDEPEIDKKISEDILITMNQMKKMWPKASVSKMQPILDELNRDLIGYKLNTRLRQAHFMAQVRQEVGASFSLREQVEYMGATALKQIGYYKTHPKQAEIDGYKKEKGPANGEVIANRMYDDNYRDAQYKLGNTSPGDGWKYLGRGLKQLTGKNNYQDLTNMYSTIWSDEKVDFVKNPKLIEQPKYAVRSAIRFWLKYKLYEIADKGTTGAQVDAITKVINKATDSYSQRRTHFALAIKIFI